MTTEAGLRGFSLDIDLDRRPMGRTMGVSSCVNHSCCDGVFSCLSLALLELQKCKPGALVIIALDGQSYTAMPLGPTYLLHVWPCFVVECLMCGDEVEAH